MTEKGRNDRKKDPQSRDSVTLLSGRAHLSSLGNNLSSSLESKNEGLCDFGKAAG
jgi:hypothetical protein